MKKGIRRSALGEIEAPGDGVLEGRYRFPGDFAGFSGHFPGRPLLPAVAQVLTAITLLETHLGKELRLKSLDRAKFLAQIVPGDEVLVQCRKSSAAGREVYGARLTDGEKLFASFVMSFEERPE